MLNRYRLRSQLLYQPPTTRHDHTLQDTLFVASFGHIHSLDLNPQRKIMAKSPALVAMHEFEEFSYTAVGNVHIYLPKPTDQPPRANISVRPRSNEYTVVT